MNSRRVLAVLGTAACGVTAACDTNGPIVNSTQALDAGGFGQHDAHGFIGRDGAAKVDGRAVANERFFFVLGHFGPFDRAGQL